MILAVDFLQARKGLRLKKVSKPFFLCVQLSCHQWILTALRDYGEAYHELRVPLDDDP